VLGFGNVGGVPATELHEKGGKVVGIADVSGGVVDRAGLDVPTLHEYAREHGSLAGFPADRLTNEELLEVECDVLVLAAREDQVGEVNATKLRCRLLAEGANGPTSVAADEVLAARGIPVLPDVLTNAGGVTVSYFEWVQDLSRLFWDRDEIRRRLADKLGDAFDRVWALSEVDGISLRSAALVSGIRDVAAALDARGIYP
jgi:glutamate dehydrogenase (NAD(P)+)